MCGGERESEMKKTKVVERREREKVKKKRTMADVPQIKTEHKLHNWSVLLTFHTRRPPFMYHLFSLILTTSFIEFLKFLNQRLNLANPIYLIWFWYITYIWSCRIGFDSALILERSVLVPSYAIMATLAIRFLQFD